MIGKWIRRFLGIESLEREIAALKKEKTVEEERMKSLRARPVTMIDRLRKLERRSFEMALEKKSPFVQNIPPGVRPPQ